MTIWVIVSEDYFTFWAAFRDKEKAEEIAEKMSKAQGVKYKTVGVWLHSNA